jgi:hypothetical protein
MTMTPIYSSTILTTRHREALITLHGNKSLNLLYRASRDGFTPSALHLRVRNIPNVFFVIKTNTNFIVTAFTTTPFTWNNTGYTKIPVGSAWLNNLESGTGVVSSTKFLLLDWAAIYGLSNWTDLYFSFGGGIDLSVSSSGKASSNPHSYSGYSNTTLFGVKSSEQPVTITEIEVYEVISSSSQPSVPRPNLLSDRIHWEGNCTDCTGLNFDYIKNQNWWNTMYKFTCVDNNGNESVSTAEFGPVNASNVSNGMSRNAREYGYPKIRLQKDGINPCGNNTLKIYSKRNIQSEPWTERKNVSNFNETGVFNGKEAGFKDAIVPIRNTTFSDRIVWNLSSGNYLSIGSYSMLNLSKSRDGNTKLTFDGSYFSSPGSNWSTNYAGPYNVIYITDRKFIIENPTTKMIHSSNGSWVENNEANRQNSIWSFQS